MIEHFNKSPCRPGQLSECAAEAIAVQPGLIYIVTNQRGHNVRHRLHSRTFPCSGAAPPENEVGTLRGALALPPE